MTMQTAAMKETVKQRQDPLRDLYRQSPEGAWIIDGAHTVDGDGTDPFHSLLRPGDGYDALWRVGIHRAVGGYHDFPNPGDILCAALASCLDSTLRMMADRLEIGIANLEIAVNGEVDVRGTLVVDRSVPVGFQRMQIQVRLWPVENTDTAKLKMLLAAAEYSCVVLQTLRNGVPIDIRSEPIKTTAS